jgi:hypothetical protein
MPSNVKNDLLNRQIAENLPEPQADASTCNRTAEKIKKYFTGLEGSLTIFSILAGVAVALLWGVQLGLIAGGAGVILSLCLALCRSPEPQQVNIWDHPGIEKMSDNDPRNPIDPETGKHLQNTINEAWQQAKQQEIDRGRQYRQEVKHVKGIVLSPEIEQGLAQKPLNFPHQLPFEDHKLVNFLIRCFLPDIIDFTQIQNVRVTDFKWGSSGGDYERPGTLSCAVLVDGVCIIFNYQDKEYRVNTFQEGEPSGFFEKREDQPEEGGGSPWKLIAINRD